MKANLENPAKPFRILSLDGGGIRGAFIAGFLAGIEKQSQCRLVDHFDLIAGTSTGGIIAAAIAIGVPAQRIEQFYLDRGERIFTRPPPTRRRWTTKLAVTFVDHLLTSFNLDYEYLNRSKYDSHELRSALVEVFGDVTLGDTTTRLVIPSINITKSQTTVFKTPHFPGLFTDRHYKLVDVLMATTAAPTYFPHAEIEGTGAFIDGGLWANNPSVAAIAEAMKIRESANRPGTDHPIELESISLLSVGTGSSLYFAQPPGNNAGLLWWGKRLVDLPSAAQSQGTNFQAMYFLGDRARRIDFSLPSKEWSLDGTEMLKELIATGRERCRESLMALRQPFFNESAFHQYVPFTTDPGCPKLVQTSPV